MKIKEVKTKVALGAKNIFNNVEEKTRSARLKLKIIKIMKTIEDKYYLIGKYIYEYGLPIDKKDKEVIDLFDYINDAYLKIEGYEKIIESINGAEKNDKRKNNKRDY